MKIITNKKIAMGWCINFIWLVVCCFVSSYTKSTGHWSNDSWDMLLFGSVLTKIGLTIIIIALHINPKMWEND